MTPDKKSTEKFVLAVLSLPVTRQVKPGRAHEIRAGIVVLAMSEIPVQAEPALRPIEPQGEEDQARPRRRRSKKNVPWPLVALLPAVLTVILAFESGGFYAGTTGLIAAEMALFMALRFALARRPLQGLSAPAAIAVVAAAGFVGWTLLSANWSDSLARAYPEYSRALLYGLTLLFFATLPFDRRRIRWMVYGVATAIVVVCGAALTARLLPHLLFDPRLVHEERLAYPLTYWNALGIMACIGVVLCAHLASSTREPLHVRALGAAAVPLLSLTLFYTLSRGGTWAAVGAVLLYIVLGRPRGLLSAAIAVTPPTLIAIAVASPVETVGATYPTGMISEGQHVALVLIACMIGAGVLRAVLAPLDNWLVGLRLPERARRPVMVGTVVVALAAVLAAATAVNAPHLVRTKYHEFTDLSSTGPGRGESRLLSVQPENRLQLWHVALNGYRKNPFHGTGAGTYVLRWQRERPSTGQVVNAHSLYLEVLGELGIVGLVLLVVVIALILGAFAYRARGPDRALFAALLAAGVAWAVHAGVDWDWQMPAVTLWLFAFGGAVLARSMQRRRRSQGRDLRNGALRVAGVLAFAAIAILPARLALSQARLESGIDAMRNGRCLQARKDAHSALSALGNRPAAYELISYCDMQLGHYRSAARTMGKARQQDPHSWQVYYGLAVSRAAAGLDPRAPARKAVAFNPNDPRAQQAASLFRTSTRSRWAQAGRHALLIAPTPADP